MFYLLNFLASLLDLNFKQTEIKQRIRVALQLIKIHRISVQRRLWLGTGRCFLAVFSFAFIKLFLYLKKMGTETEL